MKCAIVSPCVRSLVQTWAAAWCVVMVLLLSGIQLLTTGPGMPPELWLVFSAVWIFGAAMLWWFPTFGAVGTAAYGVLLTYLLWRAHGLDGANALIALGALLGSALAVWTLVERRRSGTQG